MSVILLLALLLAETGSGKVNYEQINQAGAQPEGQARTQPEGQAGAQPEGQGGAQPEGLREGRPGGDQGAPHGHYEDAETCTCTSYTSNMRTVVIKNTWSLALISEILLKIITMPFKGQPGQQDVHLHAGLSAQSALQGKRRKK